MTAEAVPHNEALTETANDRLKRTFGSWFWGSMIAATIVHFGTFAFWPELTAEDMSYESEELEAIELPPDIEIPPPPQAIARPATPIISDVSVAEDITIAPTTFEYNPVETLPPPPTEVAAEAADDIASAPTFTPYTVAPQLLNRDEVARTMVEEYPPLLKRSGIGGIVRVYFFINKEGVVEDSRVYQSSGFPQLDEAALAVADVYRFSPAMNRDKLVPVWVLLPIEFQVR
jgi:protein TonB